MNVRLRAAAAFGAFMSLNGIIYKFRIRPTGEHPSGRCNPGDRCNDLRDVADLPSDRGCHGRAGSCPARGTEQVTGNIADVKQGAGETGTAAGHVLSAAKELAHHSKDLGREVGSFLTNVKAA